MKKVKGGMFLINVKLKEQSSLFIKEMLDSKLSDHHRILGMIINCSEQLILTFDNKGYKNITLSDDDEIMNIADINGKITFIENFWNIYGIAKKGMFIIKIKNGGNTPILAGAFKNIDDIKQNFGHGVVITLGEGELGPNDEWNRKDELYCNINIKGTGRWSRWNVDDYKFTKINAQLKKYGVEEGDIITHINYAPPTAESVTNLKNNGGTISIKRREEDV